MSKITLKLPFLAHLGNFVGMGRTPLNRVKIVHIPLGRVKNTQGTWMLTGYIFGKRIRERHHDMATLALRKAELEARVMAATIGPLNRPVMTRLSDAELHNFETMRAWAADHGADLAEVLKWARSNFPLGKHVTAKECLAEWVKSLKERHRRERTLEKNRLRVEAFLRKHGEIHMREISSDMVEKHVLRPGVAPLTQIGDGQVLKTWLEWSVKRRFLANSPFCVDLEDLKGRARPAGKPVILSPEAVSRLLDAVCAVNGGKMLPYTALALFCFLRNAEAQRTKREHIHMEAAEPFVEVFPVKSGTVSYRTVLIPPIAVPMLRGEVFYSRRIWEKIRRKAKIENWQENILRHTGMSYHYARHGDIQRLTREAGNSSATAFRHYLSLARPEEAELFYGAKKPPQN